MTIKSIEVKEEGQLYTVTKSKVDGVDVGMVLTRSAMLDLSKVIAVIIEVEV